MACFNVQRDIYMKLNSEISISKQSSTSTNS